VATHTKPYSVCQRKNSLTMHRSLNMHMHGGDRYMTKVLILPSEVPRGANMIFKSSVCRIFTNLGSTKSMLWIYLYIAWNGPV